MRIHTLVSDIVDITFNVDYTMNLDSFRATLITFFIIVTVFAGNFAQGIVPLYYLDLFRAVVFLTNVLLEYAQHASVH